MSHSIKPITQEQLLALSSEEIIVTLDGQVCDFTPDISTRGLIINKDALSFQQLNTLSEDFALLEDPHTSPITEDFNPHFHDPQLRLDDEDSRVLALICDYPHQRERLRHLVQLLILWQHGFYVSEHLTEWSFLRHQQSHYNLRNPFIAQIGFDGYMLYFNNQSCQHRANPYSLENLHLLTKAYPDVKIYLGVIVPMFLYLSPEEQQEMLSYSLEQVKAIMESNWYIWDSRYTKLHLARVRKNFLIDFSKKACMMGFDEYRVPKPHPKYLSGAMTSEETNDFNTITARTQLALPFFYGRYDPLSPFVYLYLKLGSSDFEDLLQHMSDLEENNIQGAPQLVVRILCKSPKLQEDIVSLSETNPELPLSLKLELSDLDWFSYSE